MWVSLPEPQGSQLSAPGRGDGPRWSSGARRCPGQMGYGGGKGRWGRWCRRGSRELDGAQWRVGRSGSELRWGRRSWV